MVRTRSMTRAEKNCELEILANNNNKMLRAMKISFERKQQPTTTDPTTAGH